MNFSILILKLVGLYMNHLTLMKLEPLTSLMNMTSQQEDTLFFKAVITLKLLL